MDSRHYGRFLILGKTWAVVGSLYLFHEEVLEKETIATFWFLTLLLAIQL